MKHRLDDPMQYADGFTLDLYCDHTNDAHPFDAFPQSFFGTTFTDCAKQARGFGWKIHQKTRTATCPQCNK